jgi:hypothetical protein
MDAAAIPELHPGIRGSPTNAEQQKVDSSVGARLLDAG